MFGNILILKWSDITCKPHLFSVLLKTELSSVIVVMNHWIQGFSWQISIYNIFINNKAHCFLLHSFFSSCPLWRTASKKKHFNWIFWVPCHICLSCSMFVAIRIWVVAQTKTAITEWHILIHHWGSVKRAAVCRAGNQTTWDFKERMTFSQPCLLFLEGFGVGNVAIQISWKVQEIFTFAVSFPFFIPFFFVHSHLCHAFYNWNYHLFRKKNQLKWRPQTKNCCVHRYGLHKTSNFSKSKAQKTKRKCANWLACSWISMLNLVCWPKNHHGQVTNGEEAACLSLCHC